MSQTFNQTRLASYKYIEEQINEEQSDDGFSLTKKSLPSLQTSFFQHLKSYFQNQKSQRPSKNLCDLKKYLSFINDKNDILIKQMYLFTKKQYPCLKNVYKLILIYHSVSFFISRSMKHLDQLTNKRIILPDKVLTLSSFQNDEAQQVNNLLEQIKFKQEVLISRFRAILKQQVSFKITDIYMNRQEDKKILLSCKIPQFIQNSNEYRFEKDDIYLSEYRKIMNKDQIYFSVQRLNFLEEQNIKIYLYIRVIGSLDQYIDDKNYKKDNYVKQKLQKIESMSKKQMIQIIKQFNQRN